MKFQPAGTLGGIVDVMLPGDSKRIGKTGRRTTDVFVNCYPLNAIIAALGVQHVDYFSLDIERGGTGNSGDDRLDQTTHRVLHRKRATDDGRQKGEDQTTVQWNKNVQRSNCLSNRCRFRTYPAIKRLCQNI